MTDPNIPTGTSRPAGTSSHAYTRAAVDEYLHAIWQRRQALEAEILAARRRTARATRAVARLDSLEKEVGAALVAAYAQHVGTLRIRSRHMAALEAAPEPEPAEAILDLTEDDDIGEFDDIDELEESDEFAEFSDLSDLSDLATGAPDGFGDEFFGASANGASSDGSRNGTGHAAGAHRG